jgi:hypothetical protein
MDTLKSTINSQNDRFEKNYQFNKSLAKKLSDNIEQVARG